jgi:hypothetical protein
LGIIRENPVSALQAFERFPELPNELKHQIWSESIQSQPRRVLQVYFDLEMLSWRVCKDSFKPDPISQSSQEARLDYILFLDVAISPQRDIIFISDGAFTLRPIHNAFLNLPRVLQHVAITASVW